MKHQEIYQQLAHVRPGELEPLFASFCNQIVTDILDKKITMREGCYQIAGTMFIPAVEQKKELLSIALLAGELELPDHHLSQERQKLWQQLLELIRQVSPSD